MGLKVYVGDAFVLGSTKSFSGNPAGVVFLEYDDEISDQTKQAIAAELNQPITAFVSRGWVKGQNLASGNTDWAIRWFTSTLEYPLCGHASFVTANVIFKTYFKNGPKDGSTLSFHTKTKGILGATMDWNTGRVSLNFPVNIPQPLNLASESSWLTPIATDSLGPKVPLDQIEEVLYSAVTSIIIFALKCHDPTKAKALINSVIPNFPGLKAPPTGSLNLKPLLVVVTVKGYDNVADGPTFYSRTFCPAIGYDEDHACGSAHTILTPYWTGRANPETKHGNLPGPPLHGEQCSWRGADFYCQLLGNGRLSLSGSAQLSLEGTLNI